MGLVDKFLEEKDSQGQTPIFKALFKKNTNACKLLMAKNCDTTHKDSNGLTPKEFCLWYYNNVDPLFLTAYEKFEIRDIIENARNFGEIWENFQRTRVWFNEVIKFYYKKEAKKVSAVLFIIMQVSLLFSNTYYSQCVPGASFFSISFLSILLHLCMIISASFSMFYAMDPGYQAKRTLNDEENIIKHTLKAIDDQQFSSIVPEAEICFDCLLKKPKHMEHCEEVNRCVAGFQLYNPILNICVGKGNLRVYFFWCFFTFLSL